MGVAADVAVRSVVVWCPDWPVVALGRGHEPVAVVHANRVVACSVHARAHGVGRGLRRREAQRRCPTLVVLERDEAAEARAFETVALALDELTPRVEILRPGMVAFPTRGPSRYFGGDLPMAIHGVGLVDEALAGRGEVRMGVADGVFAAGLAARRASHGDVQVVEPGGSPAFLAEFPVRVLDRPELTSVLERLGLTTLGAFAALDRLDVVGRFGREGVVAHRLAAGLDEHPPSLTEPPPDMEVAADLDPPIERVDQAAFLGKVLADQFLERLAGRGAGCSRVVISAVVADGRTLSRCWRHEGALTAPAVADRVRWQLDGWLDGTSGRRPVGGLIRLSVRPDDLTPAVGRQLGFWGGPTASLDGVSRAVARVQGMLGADAVRVPERGGGRSGPEDVVTVAVDAVDLDRNGIDGRRSSAPWPGRLPAPPPAVVPVQRVPAEVVDHRGDPVVVDARSLLSSPPYQVRVGTGRWLEIIAWAGPWPLDERWWDARRARRRARLQVVGDDGQAHLLSAEGGRWWVEATYD